MAQVDRAATSALGVRAAAARERVEARALGRGLRRRRASIAACRSATSAWRIGLHLAAQLQAVEPAGVDLAGAQLGAVEQLEQEALVGGPVLDDHRSCRDSARRRRAIASSRVAPVGDDLGDHRVELGRDDVALGDAGVDADAGAGAAGAAAAMRPGDGREARRRVLGVEAHLDGVAARRRRLALEAAAGGDVQLQLDEVERR